MEFDRHRYLKNRNPTALVSVNDRPIEALHHASFKCYNDGEDPEDIWIVIISAPSANNDIQPDHAEDLAHKLGLRDDRSRRFRHEYVFDRKFSNHYGKHTVSVKTLLNRWLDLKPHLKRGFLPELQKFRCSMANMILRKTLDRYSVGRELGQMAKCFGARAPVNTIAHELLTDCPTTIEYNINSQWVK